MSGELRRGDDRDLLVAKFEVELEGILNLKEFYKQLHNYIAEWGFTDPEGQGDKFENLYFHRQTQEGLMFHHFWWRAAMQPEDDQYFRYFLWVDWQTLAVSQTEIMENNKKIKTFKGDVIVRLQSWVQLDFKNEWQKHWILKHFDESYRKRINKSAVGQHKKALYSIAYDIHDFIKRYLEMQQGSPTGAVFHPLKGH